MLKSFFLSLRELRARRYYHNRANEAARTIRSVWDGAYCDDEWTDAELNAIPNWLIPATREKFNLPNFMP